MATVFGATGMVMRQGPHFWAPADLLVASLPSLSRKTTGIRCLSCPASKMLYADTLSNLHYSRSLTIVPEMVTRLPSR